MDRTRKTGDGPGKDAGREERLAEALRQNLRRRKDQARRRNAAPAADSAEDPGRTDGPGTPNRADGPTNR